MSQLFVYNLFFPHLASQGELMLRALWNKACMTVTLKFNYHVFSATCKSTAESFEQVVEGTFESFTI